MRLFIAIAPPEDAQRALANARDALKWHTRSGRFVDDAQLHVTLKFLGETREGALNDVTDAMKEAAHTAPPLHLGVGTMGSFASGNGRIAYCGVTGDVECLGALAMALDEALHAYGFAREQRRFTPHFTLARDVRGYEALPVEETSFIADVVTLFRSDLGGGQPRYTPLHTEKLRGAT